MDIPACVKMRGEQTDFTGIGTLLLSIILDFMFDGLSQVQGVYMQGQPPVA